MELQDLVGKHMLSGVDFINDRRKIWGDEYEDCQVCRFCLDGVVYAAIEDPDDGYRSSMRELIVDNINTINNTFEPVEVLARHQTNGQYGEDDVLELIDTRTGEIVLEVGTENIDDYYPGFVANFHPEAMFINKIDI